MRSLYTDFTIMLSESELGLPVPYQVFIHSFEKKKIPVVAGTDLSL